MLCFDYRVCYVDYNPIPLLDVSQQIHGEAAMCTPVWQTNVIKINKSLSKANLAVAGGLLNAGLKVTKQALTENNKKKKISQGILGRKC